MPTQIPVYNVTDADGDTLYQYAALNAFPNTTTGTPAYTVSYFGTNLVAAVIPSSLEVTPTSVTADANDPTSFWVVLKDGVQIARIPGDITLEPDAASNPGTTVIFQNQWNPAGWASQLHDIVVIRECCLITPPPIKF